jgi:hypothetical protein
MGLVEMIRLKIRRISFLLSLFALCLVVVFVSLSSPVRAGQDQVLTVNILFPSETAPVNTTSGKWADVTFEITGASAGYYIMAINIAENGNHANIIGEYTQLIQIRHNTKTVTRQISLAPNIANGAYDVTVKVGLAEDFDPALSPSDIANNAVVVGDIQGLSQGALIVGKSMTIFAALLDQWIPSSNLNDFYKTGDATEALSDEGRDMVDNMSDAIIKELAGANDIADGTGEVASETKGSVISEVPGIIDSTLNLLSGIVELLSTDVPIEP